MFMREIMNGVSREDGGVVKGNERVIEVNEPAMCIKSRHA